MPPELESGTDIKERIQDYFPLINQVYEELDKVIVGQRYMINRLLIGLLSNGHVLLEGVPGLAKTLTVSSLAKAINTEFQRIQFTPDLLPADLIGTLIYNQKEGDFIVKKGPIFANLILADEINRSPAKVQSALLEAMQERQVTIGDNTFPLEDPFLVLATQNPVEQEGTYPLPEAQVDRFMLKIKVGYPSSQEELKIMRMMATTKKPSEIIPVLQPQQILETRELINSIYIDPKIEQYIVDLVWATRAPEEYNVPNISQLIEFGASPRATINLSLAARANAFLNQKSYVSPEDIREVAYDILRHRIILSYESEAEEKTSEDIIHTILHTIQVP